MLCICLYVCMRKYMGMSVCVCMRKCMGMSVCVCVCVRSKHPCSKSLMDAVYAGRCPQLSDKLQVVSNKYCWRFGGSKYTRR